MRQERNKAKIGIIGTDSYSNKLKLKKFIFASKKKFDVEIVTPGKTEGFDKIVRDMCHELKIRHGEFPPFHAPYTYLCALPKRLYGKNYSPRYVFAATKTMIEYCDFVVFCEEGNEKKETQYEYAQKYCKKVGKIAKFL